MKSFNFRTLLIPAVLLLSFIALNNRSSALYKLPDSGQISNYTTTFGEDSDYLINSPSYTNNGNGTVTDNITGLMWQKADGGEMTIEGAIIYCSNINLGGYSDWRLPNCHELFSILNHDKVNPATDTAYFAKTLAEYWWSTNRQIDDSTKVWVVNAGGGIGAHPKTETISAGGTKRFHVRAVRNTINNPSVRFKDNGNGTITDLVSGLIWQNLLGTTKYTWEQGLSYCENLSLAGYSDWRMPNIKELESLNNELLKNPSLDSSFFKNVQLSNYWSSTTTCNQTTKAWSMNSAYGLVSYDDKTVPNNVISVRGVSLQPMDYPGLTLIKGGDFVMGDHQGFIDPQHPSDEIPLHTVHVDSFYIGTYETTNLQFCEYLNSAKSQGLIRVQNNKVYAASGDTNAYYFLNELSPYYSISWNGTLFSVVNSKGNHPTVGVMWYGAAAYCNWLSQQLGLSQCYNLTNWSCDFTKNGIRLPTEAEWEYAGRGGQYNPYCVFSWGNDSMTLSRANWPSSGDPYETSSDSVFTTPVGFYDGQLKLKSNYNWPGSATSYQTTSGINAYGLHDMSGNAWEFVNDWYQQAYYNVSPYRNPKGPVYDSATVMPDGKKYRGLRGGNWYNGKWGHSRVANRNPSYWRGPLDPNHPWYHIGFRVARYVFSQSIGINEGNEEVNDYKLFQNYPNPFNPSTTISFTLPRRDYVSLKIYDIKGQEISVLVNQNLNEGSYTYLWNADNYSSGIYFCILKTESINKNIKMIFIK